MSSSSQYNETRNPSFQHRFTSNKVPPHPAYYSDRYENPYLTSSSQAAFRPRGDGAGQAGQTGQAGRVARTRTLSEMSSSSTTVPLSTPCSEDPAFVKRSYNTQASRSCFATLDV